MLILIKTYSKHIKLDNYQIVKIIKKQIPVATTNCIISRVFSTKKDDYQYLQKSTIPTMHFQPSLPRLPIPKLEDTCTRYLKALKPLLNEEDYNNTKVIVERFRRREGKALHAELLALDKANKHTSYISGPWFDAYLKSRSPIVLNFNPFMALKNDPKPAYNDQCIRATNILISALRFKNSLKTNILFPEVFHLNPKKSDTKTFKRVTRLLPSSLSWYGAYMFNAYPLDMSQFSSLFNSTRIPDHNKDKLFSDPTARHILIIKNGNFYVFDVVDKDGNIFPPDVIHAHMSYILSDNSPPPEYPLGYLTTEERNTWATTRVHLENASNKRLLWLVDSALFCICFDETQSLDPEGLAHTMLHGDGKNRWFDKSFQIIINKDGQTAINFEHSWGDGVAILRFFNEVYNDTINKPYVHPESAISTIDSSREVTKLDFKLDPVIRGSITAAKEKYKKVVDSLEIRVLQYDTFDKDFIKQKKLGPDAIMQLAFQIGYYNLTGQTSATYESCSTSAFKHGRTETIRPATTDARRCARAFNVRPRPSKEELRGLIKKCSESHFKLTKEAAMGQGFDRHLFVLKLLSEAKGDVPGIFLDTAYAIINHNILSTSTLSSPSLLLGGFAPVVPDGFGIGYSIDTGLLGCVVSCYRSARDADPLIDSISASLDNIYDVLSD